MCAYSAAAWKRKGKIREKKQLVFLVSPRIKGVFSKLGVQEETIGCWKK